MREYVEQVLGKTLDRFTQEDLKKLEQELEQTLSELGGSPLSVSVRFKRVQVVDRLEYIRGLNSITELRKASRSAYAKRSKAVDEDQDDKYAREIYAARDRLEEINTIIEAADDPVATAREYEEDDQGLVQRLINSYSSLDERLNRYLKYIRMTKKQAKPLIRAMPADVIPEEVLNKLSSMGDLYTAIYRDRMSRKDQRVVNINQTLLFVSKYTPEYVKANVVLHDDRGSYLKEKAEKEAKEKAKAERAAKRAKK